MSKFTYGSGARPLEGYVIKRGIGQGGFGEVYYAISDGGKEVALKLVRDNHEIELRGMAQCMNLKHPGLVTLFDIKTDKEGGAWVVMEYVAGESLSEVLHKHPQGLPAEMARQIFLDLAKAIAYLHESGIVHRDLKPANIFLENGQVKVGDYGLSKSMSGSKKSAQTQSVGTVHYMAPEISTGNYGKHIDQYAAGVILYEMLTGRCPFEGETAGEILMKHLTATPDLSALPGGLQQIVAKSLAKNPAHRYPSIRDMAAELEKLSPSGAPLAETVAYQAKPAASAVPPAAAVPMGGQSYPPLPPMPEEQYTFRDEARTLASSMLLSVIWSAIATLGWAAIELDTARPLALADHLGTFLVLVASCWAVLIPARWWDGEKKGDPWVRRSVMLVSGLGVGALAAFLNPTTASAGIGDGGWMERSHFLTHVGFFASFFGLAFFAQRWWTLASRRRERRFSLASVIWVGMIAVLPAIILQDVGAPNYPLLPNGVVLVMLTAGVVQLVSPWSEPPAKVMRSRRVRYA